MSNVTQSKQGIQSLFRAMDPTIRLLLVIVFLETTAVIFYTSVLMPYYRNLGFGPEAAGIFNSVLQVTSAITLTLSGFAADRLGRKRLFTGGQLMRCIVAGSLLFTKSYWGFVAVHVVRGLGSMQSPAQNAIVAECADRSTLATSFAFVDTLNHFAAFCTPLLAGAIADKYGVMVPFVIGLTLATLSVVLGLGIREARDKTASAGPEAVSEAGTNDGHPSSRRPRSFVSQLRDMFTNSSSSVLYLLLAANFISGLANGTVGILLPFTIMDRFSDSYSAVSGMQAAGALGTMLVLLAGGRLADTYGRRRVMLTFMMLPPAMALIFATRSLWQMYAVITTVTLIGNLSSPAVRALHLEVVREGDRASFSGLTAGLSAAGFALGSALAGFCYNWSPSGAWTLDILLFVLDGILFILAASRHEASPARRQEASTAS
ncbi:MAG: MFS transporter [Firmicutes bacterium]|nr:MFS transporter [Candidatus Fermentithermobacillaceae bacterium]